MHLCDDIMDTSASAMRWLHCNVCTKQPHLIHDEATSPAADALYVTNCGHVFCPRCLADTADAWEVGN